MKFIDISSYLGYNFAILFISYFVGHTIFSFFKTTLSKKITVYLKIILGLVFMISIFALIRTGLRTYLITVIPLTFCTFWYYKSDLNPQEYWQSFKKMEVAQLGLISITVTIVFLLSVFSIIDINGNLYEIADHPYYAGISEIMLKTGIETNNWDLALKGVRHFYFYHYFELWLGSIVVYLFGSNSLQSIILVVFVIFTSMAVYGVYILLSSSGKFETKLYLISYLILIISPIYRTLRWILDSDAGIPFNQTIISDLSFKTSVVLVFSVLLIYFRKQNFNLITILILLFCIVYPPTIAMLIPSLLLWLFFLKFKYERKVGFSLTSVFMIIIFYLITYYVNSISFKHNVSLTPLDPSLYQTPSLLSAAFSFLRENFLKILVYPLAFFFYQIISYFLFIVCLLLIIYFEKYKLKEELTEFKDLLFFLLISFIVGSYERAVLGFTENGSQITNNFFHPLFILIATLIVVYTIFRAKNWRIKTFGLVTLIIILSLNIPRVLTIYKNPIPKEDYLFLVNKLRDNGNEIAFVSTKNLNSTHVYYPYSHLRWYIKDYFPSSLSHQFLKNSLNPEVFERNRLSTNSKYFKELIIKEENISAIIQSNRIKYLLVENKYIDSVYISSRLNYYCKQLRDFKFYEFTYKE